VPFEHWQIGGITSYGSGWRKDGVIRCRKEASSSPPVGVSAHVFLPQTNISVVSLPQHSAFKIQTHKRLKIRLFHRKNETTNKQNKKQQQQKQKLIFCVGPFFKLQNNT